MDLFCLQKGIPALHEFKFGLAYTYFQFNYIYTQRLVIFMARFLSFKVLNSHLESARDEELWRVQNDLAFKEGKSFVPFDMSFRLYKNKGNG